MAKYEKAHAKYQKSAKNNKARERCWEEKGGCYLDKKAAVTSSSRRHLSRPRSKEKRVSCGSLERKYS